MLQYNKKMSLYIHIPFCVSKCAYCNFCSFKSTEQQQDEYINALLLELQNASKEYNEYKITSIYIGGGTPSILKIGEITKIMKYIKANFNIMDNISITIEANPNSLTQEKAQEYIEAGINRISLGLQSANDELLQLLHRPHNFNDFKSAIDIVRKAGFNDINVDILLGIPTQTIEILKETLTQLLSLPITHISAYGLILEENTLLTQQIEKKILKACDEDLALQMYDYTVETLKKNGFLRYEISNFCKDNKYSKHNMNYWVRGQYLGVGLASHSFINGTHWQNTSILRDYIQAPMNCKVNIEKETTATAMLETIMLGLRTEKGLNIASFNNTFDCDFKTKYNVQLQNLLANKLVALEGDFLRILNFNISNAIIEEFIE